MIRLVSVEQMRMIEQQGDTAGVSYAEMMERAGRSFGQMVRKLCPAAQRRTALGLIGGGNNGGDALVALTEMAENGWTVNAYLLRPRGADDSHLNRLIASGGTAARSDRDADFERLDDWLLGADVLIDGVLGTGARLPLKPDLAAILAHVRDFSPRPWVAAVDCPTGVDCDRGETTDVVIPADITVTMEAVKQGMLAFPAFNFLGSLFVVPLGLPDNLPVYAEIQNYVISAADVLQTLPARPRQAHKGTFGTATVVGGSQEYTGAVAFSAEAAYRIGTGLLRVATTAEVQPIVAAQLPEAVWSILPGEHGAICAEAAQPLREILGRTTAVVFGPGMGSHLGTAEMVRRLFTADSDFRWPGLPLVVDADGLRHLARIPNWYTLIPALSVLTPHPGEMSAMTGLSIAETSLDRLAVARRFAKEWNQIVLLKGAFTVIAHPDGRSAVLAAATPALAKAGTGDVLAGLIGGLLAQGVEPFSAAVSAAWLHARSGERAARLMGQSASVLARDVLAALPDVLTQITKGAVSPAQVC